ncbi:MAG TPA: biopolymer transporter ExbD [Chthoniobacterales bacterium]|jgi:biopolymer transport protein ExbD
MRLTRTRRTSPFLFQIVPLLDILFAILVFFVLSATFVSQPGVTVEPPVSSFTVEPSLHSEIVSLVGGNQPRLFFRDRLVSETQLREVLQKKKASSAGTIIVKADQSVPHERVMWTANLALQYGYRVVMAGGSEAKALGQ